MAWPQADREALHRLAYGLKIGENHLRDLMDWLEEISLRDGSPIGELLGANAVAAIESDPRLGRADKLKRIKEQVRRRRFPRLAETEDSIRARIQELKLQPAIRLSVPPGLEGGQLHVEFTASSQEEMKSWIEKLGQAAAQDSVGEIFRLLAGKTAAGE